MISLLMVFMMAHPVTCTDCHSVEPVRTACKQCHDGSTAIGQNMNHPGECVSCHYPHEVTKTIKCIDCHTDK